MNLPKYSKIRDLRLALDLEPIQHTIDKIKGRFLKGIEINKLTSEILKTTSKKAIEDIYKENIPKKKSLIYQLLTKYNELEQDKLGRTIKKGVKENQEKVKKWKEEEKVVELKECLKNLNMKNRQRIVELTKNEFLNKDWIAETIEEIVPG